MPTLPLGSVAGGYTKVETPWTSLSNVPLNDGQTYGFPYRIKWVNNQFVIPFYADSTTSVKRIYVNSDPKSGTAWTGYTTPATMERVWDIDYHNGVYVALATGSTGAVIATTTSLSGTWTIQNQYAAKEFGGLFKHGSDIYAYGLDNSNNWYLWQSSNGTTWNKYYYMERNMQPGPRAHAYFPSHNRVVFASASGSYIYYNELNMTNLAWETIEYVRAQYGSYPAGESGAGLSGIGADTTNGWIWILGGGQAWRKPLKGVNSSAVGGAWDYSYGYNPYDDIPRTMNGYDRYLGIMDNMAFNNGKMLIFGKDGRLHVFTPSSWQNGNQTSSSVASTNLPTYTDLGSTTMWGACYSPTLDYWLGIGISDNPVSYSKKYNKIIWTDKAFFA